MPLYETGRFCFAAQLALALSILFCVSSNSAEPASSKHESPKRGPSAHSTAEKKTPAKPIEPTALEAEPESNSSGMETPILDKTDSKPETEMSAEAGEEAKEVEDAEKKEEGPSDPAAMLKDARIYSIKHNYKEVILLCDKVLEKEPANLTALALRGPAYVSTGKYKEGISDISLVLKRPENAAAHPLFAARALGYLQLDEYAKAIDDCNHALKLQTKDQQYWMLRGLAYQRSKEYEQALSDFNKGIALDPEGPNLPLFLTLRSDTFSAMGKDAESLRDLNKLVKLSARDPQAWMNRAAFYIKAKEWQKAVVDLDNVIDFAPMGKLSNQALILRAEATKNCGQFKISIEDFSSLLAGYPKEPAFLYGRSEALFGAGQFEAAINDINKCIDVDASEPRFFELRAKINDALKNVDAAEADRKKAKELMPSAVK